MLISCNCEVVGFGDETEQILELMLQVYSPSEFEGLELVYKVNKCENTTYRFLTETDRLDVMLEEDKLKVLKKTGSIDYDSIKLENYSKRGKNGR